jgi:hypothetical protein
MMSTVRPLGLGVLTLCLAGSAVSPAAAQFRKPIHAPPQPSAMRRPMFTAMPAPHVVHQPAHVAVHPVSHPVVGHAAAAQGYPSNHVGRGGGWNRITPEHLTSTPLSSYFNEVASQSSSSTDY